MRSHYGRPAPPMLNPSYRLAYYSSSIPLTTSHPRSMHLILQPRKKRVRRLHPDVSSFVCFSLARPRTHALLSQLIWFPVSLQSLLIGLLYPSPNHRSVSIVGHNPYPWTAARITHTASNSFRWRGALCSLLTYEQTSL